MFTQAFQFDLDELKVQRCHSGNLTWEWFIHKMVWLNIDNNWQPLALFSDLSRSWFREGNHGFPGVLHSPQTGLQVVGWTEEVEGKKTYRQFKVKELLEIWYRLLFFQAHLNTCKHDAVRCPNKCGSQIPRIMMADHLAFTCIQRRAVCEFCNIEFTGQGLEVGVAPFFTQCFFRV